MNRQWLQAAIVAISLLSTAVGHCDDWPMWRYDAERTAASSERLPAPLKPLWTRSFPPRKPAWLDPLNQDLMTFDRVLEPIVLGNRLFVGLNDRDQLVAFDIRTGERLWSFFAEGPVRLPPVAGDGRVYFCSDDGHLYCLRASDGVLEWRFRGAPNPQHAIGNQRLVSAWPARGGPVLRDQTVYFGASIWPFMGTFLYALEARSGAVRWVNDTTGSQYHKQPHGAPSFAGVGPQGALVATSKWLLVPGGRSVPAVFDRRDGTLRYFEINAGGKGTGGSFVAADQQHFYVHTRNKETRAFLLDDGAKTTFRANEPVLFGGHVYSAATEKPATDTSTALVRAFGKDRKMLWEIAADASGDLILAGDHLYAAGQKTLTAIRLPDRDRPVGIHWQLPIAEPIERLLAASGMLIGVTRSGVIQAYGAAPPEPTPAPRQPASAPPAPPATETIPRLLQRGDPTGYAIWYRASAEPLAFGLASDSPFVQLAIVDPDPTRVDQLRRRLDRADLYGRVTVHHSAPHTFRAPQYVANMVFVDPHLTATADRRLLAELYRSVRPYGGVLHLLTNTGQPAVAARVAAAGLEQAEIEITPDSVLVRRVGALPGSADWTHQYGDVANTIKSDDQRVKLPLGLLWFGGNSNADILPRHGHGPPEQVVGGRLFVQGINQLSARDVYTGRVLWKRDFQDLGTFDVYYDATYKDTPLDPSYNQVHIPGANGRGTNYVVTADSIYLAVGDRCLVLDPATGATRQEIRLPPDAQDERREWGFLGVYEDVLLGGLGFARYRDRKQLTFEKEAKLRGNRAGFSSRSLDRAGSLALVAFDRFTGKQLWKFDALHSFWHNGIVAGGGRVFCLDKNPKLIEDALKRRGEAAPDTYRIVALDHRTGALQWQRSEGIFGTWLGYSEAHDLLLQAGAAGSDRLRVEVGRGMAVYVASTGELRWKKEQLKYAGPCILHNDWILTNANSYTASAGAFRIDTGQQKRVPNPLTGELLPWKITRTYGCNNILASEHLLTFRSGAAGFYDLSNDSGTGNFGGFKSGCTSNLVIANGVLNAPDYTRTCSCAYQNQTSLALVHMPDVDLWTIHPLAATTTKQRRIQQLGINFGAPGDRRDASGRLWLEYPRLAGASARLSIQLNPGARFYRHHSSTMAGRKHPWILASGVAAAREIRISMQLRDEFELATGLPVASADDDAEEDENGDVHLRDGDLELVDKGAPQLIGLRFNDLRLAPGAVIRKAYIQFTCQQTDSEPANLIITAENSPHAAPFQNDSHDLSIRPKTAAEVAWNPPEWMKTGESAAAQRTPDLAPLLRPVIDHPDWQAGNSVVFLISGMGKRIARACAASGRGGARLVVTADKYATRPVSEERHRVRLLFSAPPQSTAPSTVFNVFLQDQQVLSKLQLDPAGPPSRQSAEHIFEDVRIAGELQIRLEPISGEPLLSGIEVVRTPPD